MKSMQLFMLTLFIGMLALSNLNASSAVTDLRQATFVVG